MIDSQVVIKAMYEGVAGLLEKNGAPQGGMVPHTIFVMESLGEVENGIQSGVRAIDVSEAFDETFIGDGKVVVAATIAALLAQEGVLCVAFVSEGWMLSRKAGEPLPVEAPSKSPDREEVLTIEIGSGDQRALAIWKICRKPGEDCFKREGLKFGDTFSPFFPPLLKPALAMLQ